MTSKKAPKFSIITITYNAEKVLEKTIQSVVAQTYKEIQYIIIDGASKDNTKAIIHRYDEAIDVLVSEPDKGLYDAMNKGIKAVQGDYIIFLNAGDTFYNNHTLSDVASASLFAADSLWPDVIYGKTALVDAHGEFVGMRRLAPPEKLTWKSFKQGMLVCHQAFWVRSTLALDYDLTYRFSSDFDWTIRVLKKARRCYNSQQILINYLNEGITTANHKASLKERFHIMVNHYGLISTLFHHLWFVCRQLIR